MEQLDQARQLEYMFADAGLIKGVQLLNKLAALDPLRLRWHSGDARTLATSLRAVSGDDARRPVKLRCKDVGEEAFATPAESEAGRQELTTGALELTFDTPAAAASWLEENKLAAGAQLKAATEADSRVFVGGGMQVDPKRCGAQGLTGRAGIDAGEIARLEALYAEPEPEPERDVADAAEGAIRATLKQHGETDEEGLVGPAMRGQLLKDSRVGSAKLPRFFVLDARRLYYFDAQADAAPILASAQNQRYAVEAAAASCLHKGWQDLVGCTVRLLPDESVSEFLNCDTIYGLSIEEEVKHHESPQEAWRLYSVRRSERDEWVKAIQLASRPTWLGVDDRGTGMPTAEPPAPGAAKVLAQDDPRYKRCMICSQSFGINCRPSHCRRCGGVMCFKKVGKQTCTVLADLPELGYEAPQKMCTRCHHEKAPASRFVLKVPKTARASAAKAKTSVAVAAGAKKMTKKFGFGKGNKGK